MGNYYCHFFMDSTTTNNAQDNLFSRIFLNAVESLENNSSIFVEIDN